jgi:Malonate decarboxylase gamma subunit (MdcE)
MSETELKDDRRSRGRIWFAALAGTKCKQLCSIGSVLAGDTDLGENRVRYLAVVPDPENRFPRILAFNDPGVVIHAMGKQAAARVTKRSVLELDELAGKVLPLSYDVQAFAQLGILHGNLPILLRSSNGPMLVYHPWKSFDECRLHISGAGITRAGDVAFPSEASSRSAHSGRSRFDS